MKRLFSKLLSLRLSPHVLLLALFACIFLTGAGVVIYQGSLVVPPGGSIQDLTQPAGCAQYNALGYLGSVGSNCTTATQVEICPSPGTGVTITPPWPCTIAVSGSTGIWSVTYQNTGDTSPVQAYTQACVNNGAAPPTPCPFIALGLHPDTSTYAYSYPGTNASNPGGFAMYGQIVVGDNLNGGGFPGSGACQNGSSQLGPGWICSTYGICIGTLLYAGPGCLEYHPGSTAYWEFNAPGGAGASAIRSTSFSPLSAVCTSNDAPPALVTGSACPFNGAQPVYDFSGAQHSSSHFDVPAPGNDISVSCGSGVTSCNTTVTLTGNATYAANQYDCTFASNSNTTGALISNIIGSSFSTSSFVTTVVFSAATPHSGTVLVFAICVGQ